MQHTPGALEGIRVLDLGRVMSAPLTTSLLADMGADVIKIEQPDGGDDSRVFMPKVDGLSTYFVTFNRGKRGVTLNLKGGKDILLKLVQTADVIVENFRPGVMNRLGLGYEDLKKVNPRIIMASVSGFGQTGPYSQRAGYDTIGQAMGGVMGVTGFENGGVPTRCGAAVGDVTSGLSAVVGILAALEHREISGEGQYVDCSLADTSVVVASDMNESYFIDGSVPKRQGNAIRAYAPADCYETADDYIICCCEDDADFAALCKILGQEALLSNPDYATNELRVKNRDALDKVIEAATKGKSTADWLVPMLDAGLACAPVLTIEQTVADPQIGGARNMYPFTQYGSLGEVRFTGGAVKMSETPPKYVKSAPLLGEDNEAIFCGELGYTSEELAALKEQNVI